MKISSKGRYALAAMILMAQETTQNESITVLEISQKLGISKIYLEQVFSLLRRGELVTSTKGAQGGYSLERSAMEITAADILSATETSIFDVPESTVKDTQPGIERALHKALFVPANNAFKEVFERMPLSDLAEEALKGDSLDGYIYYI
ncbi:MAG: Rrf2 family transcriptional regulator [Clostridiales bacterium]|jgi:Rrf2 family cysteine metabolism transcriptional repressor|nr:Rrf2 family transcriptional regulator [Clostridiales bacterium]